jgi:two-component system sensor histidine kinase and response regulator WspE
MSTTDFSDFSMFELFRTEADNQVKILTAGLLILEQGRDDGKQTEGLMRAAHSLKGAARIVDLNAAVRVSHALEDCFVAAQEGKVVLGQKQIDHLLKGVDLLVKIAQTPEEEVARWENAQKGEIDSFVAGVAGLLEGRKPAAMPAPAPAAIRETKTSETKTEPVPTAAAAALAQKDADRVLRVTADNLNRLLGLAGESLVESRHLNSFTDSLLRLKRQQGELTRMLDACTGALSGHGINEEARGRLAEIQSKVMECRQFLADRLVDLEMFDRRSVNLSHRLYEEALACRMRPFADGVHGFPRMARDVARALEKEVRMEIVGESTMVDRDVLEKLEAPLTHLVRNAVDHGLELPAQRLRAGKPKEGRLRLEARHTAGMLQVIVSDDGRGIDPEALREAIVQKKLTNAETASTLSEGELLEFLFLPGFSMKESVTEISGRGVGLDVVRTMVKQARGTVRISSQPGQGTRFQLQLPLTLSVARTLLVEIDDEPYAFPLAYISRMLKLPKSKIEMLEGRQHFEFEGRQIGLVTAHQVLGRGEIKPGGEELPIVVVEEGAQVYGVVVDRFLGEREVVVHPLDPRLGKIKDISAGALMEDGAPALIIDVEDLIHSIDQLISSGPVNKIAETAAPLAVRKGKRVLIVDDSLTVRELERKLLENAGYAAEVAVNGMDGWNAARAGGFDLVISDVDMPRMDGIELVTLIKKDAALKSLPVIIVSFKDREEDRQRGLEAGADYYMTKESFSAEALLEAVRDMIGEPFS